MKIKLDDLLKEKGQVDVEDIEISFNGETYFLVNKQEINIIDSINNMLDEFNSTGVSFMFSKPKDDLSFSEYEKIKKDILKMLEENYRPKPENLN